MVTANVVVSPQYNECNSTVSLEENNQISTELKTCCQPIINKLGMRYGEIKLEVEQGIFKGIDPSYNLYTKIFVNKNAQS